MTDASVRELERRWLTSGDLAHGVALLRERLRLGLLDPTRLELAAWLGHPVAKALLGAEAPVGRHAGRNEWLRALDREAMQILVEVERQHLPADEPDRQERLARLDQLEALLRSEREGAGSAALE